MLRHADRLLMQRLRRNKSHQQMEDLSVSGSLPSGFASLRDAGLLESMPQLSAEGWERLVVVANRLPVTCSRDASGKWQLQVRRSTCTPQQQYRCSASSLRS